MRKRAEIVRIKSEDQIEEQFFLVGKEMRGKIEEARPCIIVPCIYRDGTLRLWPLMLPRANEKDMRAWASARSAARAAVNTWIKLVWSRGVYLRRPAQEGYAPNPDWSKVPSTDELVGLGWGSAGIIRGVSHPAYQTLMGAAPATADDDADDADDL
jgi:hypothetical protein